ncbi:MAG: PIN domain-containing protein [Nanoarchaeota archaeon]
MDKLIVDSSAWIEYLDGSPEGEKVRKYFKEKQLFTPANCVGEIIARAIRTGISVELVKTVLNAQSTIISIDFEIGYQGGILYTELRKQKPKISLSDALTLAIAKKLNAKILTFDNDFQGLAEAIVL